MAGAWIDKARGQLAAEGVVQTGLIAGNTGRNLRGAAAGGLGHKIRVRQKGPRHRHHIGHARGKQAFGDLGRINAV
ncbi:MAG: hypothetical protein RI979_2411 [Pseudomonadota bacterium]